ncbi:hypothetical protein HRbin06_00858 [archaeon HR06]|nr:hypothetical protein HRbin06_00858 [archaeon HR06]
MVKVFLKCKECSIYFNAGFEIENLVDFLKVKDDEEYTCPLGHKNRYKKEDYILEYERRGRRVAGRPI